MEKKIHEYDEHAFFFRQQCFLNIDTLVFFINPSLINTR